MQNSLPQCKIIILNVINRTDDGKASLIVENLNNHLNLLKLDIVDNSNIGKEYVSKKRLYLIDRGSRKLAINLSIKLEG